MAGAARCNQSRKCGVELLTGCLLSNAEMAPHCEWPQMTMSLTRKVATANSMAAAVELVSPITFDGGTMLPTFSTTNKSPGRLCVMSSASTRESEQVMNSVCGFCPSCDNLRNSLR